MCKNCGCGSDEPKQDETPGGGAPAAPPETPAPEGMPSAPEAPAAPEAPPTEEGASEEPSEE